MGLWTPADGDFRLWLDASDDSTLFDSVSGGSSVTSGTAVARIEDKGTGGFDFTQSTAGKLPIWQDLVQNGLGVLRFTSDYLTNAAYDADSNQQGLTRFLLAKTNSGSTNQVAFSSAGASHAIQHFGGAIYSYERSGVYANTAIGITTTAFSMYVVVYDGSQPASHADRIKLYRNGTLLSWAASSGTIGTTTGSGIGSDIGRPLGTDSVADWNGDIGELGTAQRALSVGDRQTLEGYMAHKWGITSTLPADHPYRSVAPVAGSTGSLRLSTRSRSRLSLRL